MDLLFETAHDHHFCADPLPLNLPQASPLSATELMIVREFEAPPSVLKQYLTDPALIQDWLNIWDIPLDVCEFEPWTGGRARIGWYDGASHEVRAQVLDHSGDKMVMQITAPGHGQAGRPILTATIARAPSAAAARDQRSVLRLVFGYPSARAMRDFVRIDMEIELGFCFNALDERFIRSTHT